MSRIIRVLLLCGLCIAVAHQVANAQSFQWEVSAYGTPSTGMVGPLTWYLSLIAQSSSVNSIGSDAAGNIYLIGTNSSPTTIGGVSIPASSGAGAFFIAKIDPDGKVLWGVHPDATNATGGGARGFAVDRAGNVYVIGDHAGSMKFGDRSVEGGYFVKYTPAGELAWVREFRGVGYPVLGADEQGNIYMSAYATSWHITSEGSDLITFSTDHLQHIVATKFTSDGNAIWTKDIATTPDVTGSMLVARAVGADASGDLYLAGIFNAGTTFGSQTLSSNGGKEMFLARLDASGQLQWTRQSSTTKPTGDVWGVEPQDLAADAAGNVYVTGAYRGATTIGSTTLSGGGPFDFGSMFTAKWNSAGGLQWVKTVGGLFTAGTGVRVDGSGNVYVAGNGASTSFGGDTVKNGGAFIGKYSADGNPIWSRSAAVLSGSNKANSGGIAIDGSGNAVMTGTFQADIIFGNSTLPKTGLIDIYVVKVGSGTTVVVPATPVGISPSSGATLPDTTVTFIWSSATDAVSYHLQVSTNASFSGTMVLDQDQITDTSRFVAGLSYATTYYWRVQANGPGKTDRKEPRIESVPGNWSQVMDFATPPEQTSSVASPLPARSTEITFKPNPATSAIVVHISLARTGPVELALYDLLGRKLRILAAGSRPAGQLSITTDIDDLPPGRYLCRLRTPEGVTSEILTIAR